MKKNLKSIELFLSLGLVTTIGVSSSSPVDAMENTSGNIKYLPQKH